MLNVKSFTFNPFQENTYIIYNDNKNCIIVDPGMYDVAECDILFNFIYQHKLNVTQIANTHCHLDHIFGVNACMEKYNCSFTYHKEEQIVMDWAASAALMYSMQLDMPSRASYLISENDTLQLDTDILTILFTPGHSPGSICFYSENNHFLIAGDVIFNQSVGRTDLPGGNTEQLLKSIQSTVFALPDNTTIYSGHGPETSIGSEKMNNPFVKIQ